MSEEKRKYTICDILAPNSDLFDETGKPLFMNESYFKQKSYDFLSKMRKSEKNGQKCMMPDCNKKPIKYSHTIPEKAVLRKISDSTGHVLFPKYLTQGRRYKMEPIGVNIASTFSGFCSEHENIFSGFESKGDFSDESIGMQNFRVLCRDMFYIQNRKKKLENVLCGYKNELLKYHEDLMQNIHAKQKITYVGDENTKHMEECIKVLDGEINLLYEDIYDDFVKDLSGVEKIECLVLDIPFKLPIAFAGRSRFGIKNAQKETLFSVVLSILPSDDSTALCFSIPTKNKDNFLYILCQYDDMVSLLSFIESWIIYGSDYWFIEPKYWDAMSHQKQQKILDDLLIKEYFPTNELQYSIFDDVSQLLRN